MRRRYTTARFAGRIEAVRRLMPDAFIGIDVIVGFPGETEADFGETYAFLERTAPAFLHIFPFSERPGTPAVALPGKLQPAVAARRGAELEALCERLHGTFCAKAVGTEDRVLFESTRRGGMMFGFTGNYRRVKAPTTAPASTPFAGCGSARWMNRTISRVKFSIKFVSLQE